MPSNVAHYYFAEKVYQGLPQELQTVICKDKQAFAVGAQGPDLLFYMRFEKPPLNKLGEKLHLSYSTSDLLGKSALYAKENDTDTLSAFLFGQLCHYALDSELHPYVYHREKDLPSHYPKSAAKYIHVIFESGLDYLCVRDCVNHSTALYKSYKNLNLSKTSLSAIGRYYSDVVAPEFGMDLPPKTAERSIKLMRLFLRITDDTTRIKYLLIRGFETLMRAPRCVSAFIRPRKDRPAEDWLNHNRTPYPKYKNKDEADQKTVEEMAAAAHTKAVGLIVNLYGFMKGENDIDATLYTKNYTGALSEAD